MFLPRNIQPALALSRILSLRSLHPSNFSHLSSLSTPNISSNHQLLVARNIASTSRLHESLKPIEVPPPPADTFGALGGLKYEAVELDADEQKEEDRLKYKNLRVPRKHKPSPGGYAKMIKQHVTQGDLDSAEKVLELCKQNLDKPTEYMYSLLINAFATHGDLKRCYKYYGEMKSRKYPIKANIYTSLLNGCANYANSDKALDYLRRILEQMEERSFEMNHAHYNCLVKVYGRHNQLEKANEVVQLMMNNRMKIGVSTINSLMYAANTDLAGGLKAIVQYWQLMRKMKIPPDIFTYHLLLRGIRDTKFGGASIEDVLLADPDATSPVAVVDKNRPDLLLHPPVVSDLRLLDDATVKPAKNVKLLAAATAAKRDEFDNDEDRRLSAVESTGSSDSNKDESNSDESSSSNKLVKKNEDKKVDGSGGGGGAVGMASIPESIRRLDLDAILARNKLILFGGVESLLEKMREDNIVANVKTATYLVELVPSSVAAENAIIKWARENKIRMDIDFFNMLIKKRCMRGLKKEAKELLHQIHKHDLRPNIVTYGVLALACSTSAESREMIEAMRSTGHVINKYVADTLLNSAIKMRDIYYILELMELMYKERVRLEVGTFEKLDEFQKRMSELVRTKHKVTKRENFKLAFSKFNMRYKDWQDEMGRKVIVERAAKEKERADYV